MAIIADDSPSKEKESPAEITMMVNEPPANEGFCTDKTTDVLQQPLNIKQDPDKEPLPPPEITAEPESSGPLPVETKVKKKKRQRKRKSKKIKAVVLVKGPRTKPGILSGKFHLTLPKKAVRNAMICTQSVPVPDCPLTLSHNDHRITFQTPTFCPEKVHISDSCAACFEETSLLKIICSSAAVIEVWGEPRRGNGDVTFIKMTSEATGCNYFINKSQRLRKKRSIEQNPGANLRGKKETSVEEKKENLTPDTYNDESCTITVPVTDFPIVIKKGGDPVIFNEVTFCPESAEAMKNCFACFKNLKLLEISYRKNGNKDLEPLWVEHGKGRGTSDRVDMNSAVCQKIAMDVSHIQSHQSDGGTSTENTAGSRGQSLQYISILAIPIVFFAAIFVFA
ncbi:uncharacterized protein [Phyllobates terribilis]|uniref:uncharacterized protein isoform X2 n=1 Tax=Phyllobates terribilis TaxID=111132 RepID=UPI003CCAE9B0